MVSSDTLNYHYIKIIVVHRVCLLATEGQQKRFDLEVQGAVSLVVEGKKIEIGTLCERQSWH